jgi:hypothetical protein
LRGFGERQTPPLSLLHTVRCIKNTVIRDLVFFTKPLESRYMSVPLRQRFCKTLGKAESSIVVYDSLKCSAVRDRQSFWIICIYAGSLVKERRLRVIQ